MSSAVFALSVNTAVAALFAMMFLMLALSKGAPASARWFAAAYGIGMLTPISELGIRFTSLYPVFKFGSSITFVSAFLLSAVALAKHFDQRPPWKAILVVFVLALLVRIGIWHGVRNTMPYEILNQLPFAVAATLCWWVAHQGDAQSQGRKAVSFAFLFISLHFIFKAQAAVLLGSGDTAQAYASSSYALFSQSVTSILLIGTGLLILHLIFTQMLSRAHSASEIDPLSGLLNRRGFEISAAALIDRSNSKRSHVALILFDLDHFKIINDTYGHATGDDVIRRFADVLRLGRTAHSICARIGGEEFAVVIENCDAAAASLYAGNVRTQVDSAQFASARVTVSAGLTAQKGHTVLSELLMQADLALYSAKRSGRNCVKGYLKSNSTVDGVKRSVDQQTA